MTQMKMTAGDSFPQTTVSQLGGGELILGVPQNGREWQMVVVYRGKHCPMCTQYLGTLNDMLSKFHDLSIDVVAVSGDTEVKAKSQIDQVSPDFPVGYGLTVPQMRELGLYISHPRSPEETDVPFAEPGLYVVNSDGKAQVVDISNAPFARPELQTLAMGLEFIRNPKNNYPIRGTHG